MGAQLDRMKAAAAEAKGQKTKRLPARQPVNSPVGPTRAEKIAARDKEMDERGRWPGGTIVTLHYLNHKWTANVEVPLPLTREDVEACQPRLWKCFSQGQAAHELLTTVYQAWLEAGKPGAS